MRSSRPLYRIQQFWQTIRAKEPSDEELVPARDLLTPKQMGLFMVMHPADKAHALEVLKKLRLRGEKNLDLLAAALLHDVGKIRYPMSAWQSSKRLLHVCTYPPRN